jgi:hypothetical protein
MLVAVPHTMRLALSVRSARRADGPGRLMAALALVGAGMIAAAVVLAVVGSGPALEVGVTGAVVQATGFVGALWWALRRPPPRCDRGRREGHDEDSGHRRRP